MSTASGKTSQTSWVIGWGFSSRCDLNCPFCYSRGVRDESSTWELELVRAEEFLTGNRSRISAINFGTGECFLSPRFPELLVLVRRWVPGAKIAVTTNGAAWDWYQDKELRELLINCIDELDVSLDFSTPEQHDLLRGATGTFERARSVLSLGSELGVAMSLVMLGMPSTLGQDNIEGLVRIAASSEAALRLNSYMPVHAGLEFSPAWEDLESAFQVLSQGDALVCSSDPLFKCRLATMRRPGALDKPLSTCRILPDGRVSPSTYLLSDPWVVAGPLEDLQLDRLQRLMPFQLYRSPPVPPECDGCAHQSSCAGGSIERRWLWHGHLRTRDPYCPGAVHPSTQRKAREAIELVPTNWSGPAVHLDYLPTTVALFGPGQKNRSAGSARASVRTNDRSLCCFREVSDGGPRVLWEITSRCEFNCLHCFRKNDYGREPLPETLQGIADRLIEAGSSKVILTGGEPLLRPDLFSLGARLSGAGMVVDVNSSGWNVDREMAERAAEAGITEFTVSIDGATPAVHDRMRRKSGSFGKAVAAISELKRAGVTVDICCCLTRLNWMDVEQILASASGWGVASVALNGYMSASGRPTDKSLGLGPAELLELAGWIDDHTANGGIPVRTARLLPAEGRASCPALRSVVAIDAEGRCHPCGILRVDDAQAPQLPARSLNEAMRDLSWVTGWLRQPHSDGCANGQYGGCSACPGEREVREESKLSCDRLCVHGPAGSPA